MNIDLLLTTIGKMILLALAVFRTNSEPGIALELSNDH